MAYEANIVRTDALVPYKEPFVRMGPTQMSDAAVFTNTVNIVGSLTLEGGGLPHNPVNHISNEANLSIGDSATSLVTEQAANRYTNLRVNMPSNTKLRKIPLHPRYRWDGSWEVPGSQIGSDGIVWYPNVTLCGIHASPGFNDGVISATTMPMTMPLDYAEGTTITIEVIHAQNMDSIVDMNYITADVNYDRVGDLPTADATHERVARSLPSSRIIQSTMLPMSYANLRVGDLVSVRIGRSGVNNASSTYLLAANLIYQAV